MLIMGINWGDVNDKSPLRVWDHSTSIIGWQAKQRNEQAHGPCKTTSILAGVRRH
jgi:hypothetical protein